MKINNKNITGRAITFGFLFILTLYLFSCGNSEQIGKENDVDKKPVSSSGNIEKKSSGVQISEISQKSIGLKLVNADFRPMEKVLQINGIVKTEPDKIADITSRIDGRIERIYVNLGDEVKKGQKLVSILPRQIGTPPLVSITTPLKGIVVERNVSLGGTVESNKTLFRIADLSGVIVEGELYEGDVTKVKLGQNARIKLDAYPNKVFNGKVTFVASELDPRKRLLHLWVSVENNEDLLKPELFANVTIILDQGDEVITVPVGAIIEDGVEQFVFVKNGNLFTRQDVLTGVSDDRFTEIIEGLYPGDEVVTDGNRQIYTKWLFSR